MLWSAGVDDLREGEVTCSWKPLGDGIYAPGCLGGVVTDMTLILKPHYDYCPFCGSKAKYGDNGIKAYQIRRRAEIRRLGA